MSKNPPDATLKNTRAGNKRDVIQNEKIKSLDRRVKNLELAVKKLITRK